MRIAIVSGSLPPDRCGVGDYADRLAGALRDLGQEVVCLGGEPWTGLGALRDLRRILKAGLVDIVHLQYPTMGFGRSIVPALLPLLSRHVPIVVTIHEFSSFRVVRRPWFLTFAHCVDLRIFTSQQERQTFARCMKPLRGQDLVVPIGSNIPMAAETRRQEKTICYFGLLCPGKGIEDFLQLAASAAHRDWRFALIGAETKMYAAYSQRLIEKARSLNVALHLDRSETDVGRLLGAMEIAYLPFPDGACSTRGSLHAVMRNGAVVVTKHAEQTCGGIRAATVHANGPDEAGERIAMLFDSPRLMDDIRGRARSVAPGWRDIAEAHLAGFTSAIAERSAKAKTSALGVALVAGAPSQSGERGEVDVYAQLARGYNRHD